MASSSIIQTTMAVPKSRTDPVKVKIITTLPEFSKILPKESIVAANKTWAEFLVTCGVDIDNPTQYKIAADGNKAKLNEIVYHAAKWHDSGEFTVSLVKDGRGRPRGSTAAAAVGAGVKRTKAGGAGGANTDVQEEEEEEAPDPAENQATPTQVVQNGDYESAEEGEANDNDNDTSVVRGRGGRSRGGGGLTSVRGLRGGRKRVESRIPEPASGAVVEHVQNSIVKPIRGGRGAARGGRGGRSVIESLASERRRRPSSDILDVEVGRSRRHSSSRQPPPLPSFKYDDDDTSADGIDDSSVEATGGSGEQILENGDSDTVSGVKKDGRGKNKSSRGHGGGTGAASGRGVRGGRLRGGVVVASRGAAAGTGRSSGRGRGKGHNTRTPSPDISIIPASVPGPSTRRSSTRPRRRPRRISDSPSVDLLNSTTQLHHFSLFLPPTPTTMEEAPDGAEVDSNDAPPADEVDDDDGVARAGAAPTKGRRGRRTRKRPIEEDEEEAPPVVVNIADDDNDDTEVVVDEEEINDDEQDKDQDDGDSDSDDGGELEEYLYRLPTPVDMEAWLVQRGVGELGGPAHEARLAAIAAAAPTFGPCTSASICTNASDGGRGRGRGRSGVRAKARIYTFNTVNNEVGTNIIAVSDGSGSGIGAAVGMTQNGLDGDNDNELPPPPATAEPAPRKRGRPAAQLNKGQVVVVNGEADASDDDNDASARSTPPGHGAINNNVGHSVPIPPAIAGPSSRVSHNNAAPPPPPPPHQQQEQPQDLFIKQKFMDHCLMLRSADLVKMRDELIEISYASDGGGMDWCRRAPLSIGFLDRALRIPIWMKEQEQAATLKLQQEKHAEELKLKKAAKLKQMQELRKLEKAQQSQQKSQQSQSQQQSQHLIPPQRTLQLQQQPEIDEDELLDID